jgi:heptosyltransferase-3
MAIGDQPNRVLIVCLRRLGDVLLTTPVALSLKSAWPEVKIDWLVFEGTEGILTNNPVANTVLVIPPQAGLFSLFETVSKIFQRYDLALSTQSGDRPSLFARLAGKQAVTFRSTSSRGAVRDWMFTKTVTAKPVHRVAQILSVLEPLNVNECPELSTPDPDFSALSNLPARPIVTLHPGAAFRYKLWSVAGWRTLAERFLSKGFYVVITGGDSLSEKEYIDEIFYGMQVVRRDGVLSWPQLVGLLKRTEFFVGVDTSVTHLAAAVGVMGLAIYGPTDQRIWGPHPYRGRHTIAVIQNTTLSCVPCQQEGCDRHHESRAQCLDTLSADQIWLKISERFVHRTPTV